MIDIFLSWAKALWIEDTNVYDLIFLIFQDKWLSPNPNSFSFRICGWSNCKACFLFQKDSIEKVRLASSIYPCNRNDSNFALDSLKEGKSLRISDIL